MSLQGYQRLQFARDIPINEHSNFKSVWNSNCNSGNENRKLIAVWIHCSSCLPKPRKRTKMPRRREVRRGKERIREKEKEREKARRITRKQMKSQRLNRKHVCVQHGRISDNTASIFSGATNVALYLTASFILWFISAGKNTTICAFISARRKHTSVAIATASIAAIPTILHITAHAENQKMF